MKTAFIDIVKDGILTKLTKWLIAMWFRRHFPGAVEFELNRIIQTHVGSKYNAIHISGVMVSLWKRGGYEFAVVSLAGDRSARNVALAKKLMRTGIDDLDGKTMRIKGML